MSAVEVVEKIARWRCLHADRITFPEGLTIAEMAKVYEARGFGRARTSSRRPAMPRSCSDLDPKATDLEGYLFPETYSSAAQRARVASWSALMVDRFRAIYDDDAAAAAPSAQGLTTRQVVTLASLVEKETGRLTNGRSCRRCIATG